MQSGEYEKKKGGVMENEKVRDLRRIKMEKVMESDYIPFLSGRPKRKTVIGKDDSYNLQIALYNSKSIEDFLTQV
jgi:hypothetical protein